MTSTEHLAVPNQLGYHLASKALFKPYISVRGGIEAKGMDNLPQGSAPYILAVSHRSLLDIPTIGQVLLDYDATQIHFVAKKELWKRRLLAKYFDSTGVIKYDRDLKMSKQPQVGEAMNKVLQTNGVLGMFPEGTRHKGPELQVRNRGLGMLAVSNAVPIATAGIYGTESLWDRIYVCFGNTIYPGPLGENRRRRMVEMEEKYQESLQQAIHGAYEMAGIDASSVLAN